MNEDTSAHDELNSHNGDNDNDSDEVVEEMNGNVMHKGNTRQAETHVVSNAQLP